MIRMVTFTICMLVAVIQIVNITALSYGYYLYGVQYNTYGNLYSLHCRECNTDCPSHDIYVLVIICMV